MAMTAAGTIQREQVLLPATVNQIRSFRSMIGHYRHEKMNVDVIPETPEFAQELAQIDDLNYRLWTQEGEYSEEDDILTDTTTSLGFPVSRYDAGLLIAAIELKYGAYLNGDWPELNAVIEHLRSLDLAFWVAEAEQ